MRARTESARDVRIMGTRAPSTIPAASALARKVRFLASILPASRSGTTRICARPATSRANAFDLRCLRINCVIESKRTVEQTSRDLPAISHLAQRGRLDRRGNLRRHCFDRREYCHPRSAKTNLGEEVDRVLDDIALSIEIRKNIDRGIGNEQRFAIGGHVHDKDMADPPCGAQSGRSRGNAAHKLIGMQAALHQQLALALTNQFDSLCRCRLAVRHVDNLKTTNVKLVLASYGGDLAAGPTRIGMIMPASAASVTPRSEVSSHGCTTIVVAGRNLLSLRNQPLVFGTRRMSRRLLRAGCLSRFLWFGRHRWHSPNGPAGLSNDPSLYDALTHVLSI